MTASRILLTIAFAALGMACSPAGAAESYDSCTNVITSLPATIATQGTWCLHGDLSTAQTSGAAILVNTNNVTIDCNQFKVGGVAAGAGTLAIGIRSSGRSNITVRNCNVRGFFDGALIDGGSGHVVEDNRFEGNTQAGIVVQGDASVIRRNLVIGSGQSTSPGVDNAYGISTQSAVDIIDNTIGGVAAQAGSNGSAYGILASTISGTAPSISGNRVRDLAPAGTGSARGITVGSNVPAVLNDNLVYGPGAGIGIGCVSGTARARDNIINGFATGLSFCTNAVGNDITP